MLGLLEGSLNVIDNLLLECLQESLGFREDLACDVGDILNDPGWLRSRLMCVSMAIKDLGEVPRSTTVPGKEL